MSIHLLTPQSKHRSFNLLTALLPRTFAPTSIHRLTPQSKHRSFNRPTALLPRAFAPTSIHRLTPQSKHRSSPLLISRPAIPLFALLSGCRRHPLASLRSAAPNPHRSHPLQTSLQHASPAKRGDSAKQHVASAHASAREAAANDASHAAPLAHANGNSASKPSAPACATAANKT